MNEKLQRPRVVVIDDDVGVLASLKRLFTQRGFDVTAIAEPMEGLLAACEPDVAVVLSDIQMPNLTGLELLKELKRRKVEVEVVLMTGNVSVESAVEALKAGAYDYVSKPFDDPERLTHLVLLAAERRQLKLRANTLAHMLEGKQAFDDMVGQSAKMADVFRLVKSIAPTSVTVVIGGESGTGKELVARALHRHSPRVSKPFVTVNCSALTETLLESELFGHIKGAFTGAFAAKKGLFQAASGGTILLDEIGDMPLSIQTRLLRVLQEGEVRPVGSTVNIPVDVRVIAATHIDLEKAMANGSFREDLYYRLNVMSVQLPPLRDRPEDIEPLACHFLSISSAKLKKRVTSISADAVSKLVAHRWPGNVRELQNAIERGVVLAQTETLTEKELPPTLGTLLNVSEVDAASLSQLPFADAKALAMSAFERRYLATLLRNKQGNVTRAAEAAKMDRSNFRRLLKQRGVAARLEAVDEAIGTVETGSTDA